MAIFPKIKVDRLKQPTKVSKQADIRRKTANPDRKGLFGLFKFIGGFDKKKTF